MTITSEHFESFYGIVPDKPEMYIKSFKPLVQSIYKSITKKYPNIPENIKHKGVMAGLKFLKSLPEKETRIVLTRFNGDLIMKGKVLEEASTEISRYVDIQNTHEYIKKSRQVKKQPKKVSTTDLYQEYKGLVSYWIKEGLPETSSLVAAYKDLLEKYTNPTGKIFYDLLCGIPFEYQIYNNDEIILAVNHHPKLPNRQKQTFNNLQLPSFRKVNT